MAITINNMISIDNIKDLNIGDIIKGHYNNDCIITDKTAKSLRLDIKARSKAGINSNDWYSIDELKQYRLI